MPVLLAELQACSDAETSNDDGQDHFEWTPLSRAAKCVVGPPITETSVSLQTSHPRLIYMVPHPNPMRDRTVLSASGILNSVLHQNMEIKVANFPKKPTTMWKGMLFGVGTVPLELIVHLVQAEALP